MAYLNLVRLVRMRRALDAALLGGVSALALMAGSQLSEAASKQNAGSVAPTVAAQQAATAAALQAAQAAAQAQSSLNRAAEALAAAQRLQGAAAAAGSSLFVPNGLVLGGLVPTDTTNSNEWINAHAPVQSISGSQVTVSIQQTAPKAVLYWNTFNVGANTTVNFQQQQSDWIAFNRVYNSTSPSQILGNVNALGAVYVINSNGIIFGAGSQVNVNTLIASSLDIGPLGYTLDQRDKYFKNIGITSGVTLNSFSFYDWATQGSATSNAVAGDITVQRGAKITANIATDQGSQPSPGNIYLFGANVYNHGWLIAPTGEIGLVAARAIDMVTDGFTVLPASVLGTDPSGKALSYKGTEFSVSNFASSYDSSGNPQGGYLANTGAVTHDGLIQASRGNVIMQGDAVTIDNPRDASGNLLTDAATGSLVQGVISADTSIDRNSFVMLRAATSVTMNGVITSLPYDDGAQPLPVGGSAGSAVQSFTPPYIEMSAQSTVTMGSSGLISAPSAVVSLRAVNLSYSNSSTNLYTSPGGTQYGLFNLPTVAAPPSNTGSAQQTVLLSPGAIIDVAGLENVTLPASYNFISFQPRGEFADMPLQRNGPLYGQTLWIDIRDSDTRSDGTSWLGTPLADANYYVSGVGRSIYQLMTTGGSVNLQTDLGTNNGGGKVQTARSVINVAAGSEYFQPGWVPTTLLLGADGRIYDMADADPNRVYVGFANQFTVDHSRWGITQTWSTQTYSSGYSQGQAAGSVSVTTVNPNLLGTIYFGSVAGERQIESGQLPSQGSLSLTTPSSVQIGSTGSADYTTRSTVTVLSADTLSSYGLSSLSITSNDLVVSSGSTLNLAPGGSFSALAGAIDIAGTVAAAGGTISLKTDRFTLGSPTNSGGLFGSLFKAPTDSSGRVLAANIYVEGTLDVSGRFVNDTDRTGSDIGGPADINGGTISIQTSTSSAQVNNQQQIDTTGAILLASTSLLDVSSGGYVSQQGKPLMASPTVIAGQAGSITLATYQLSSGQKQPWSTDTNNTAALNYIPSPGAAPSGVIQLDGRLLGYGFQSDGSLTLSGVDNIQIGGTLPIGGTSDIRIGGVAAPLPVSLFTSGGFGNYTVQAVADGYSPATSNITVAAGVNLTLQQQNFQSLIGSSIIDYSTVATGTKLGQLASPALSVLPPDQRQPVNLTLNADNILLGTGSTVVTDPAAKITLGDVANNLGVYNTGSKPAQSVTLLGSIIDHGGSVFINATATQLGSQALVDLSGTFVANSTFGWQGGGSLTSGTYLPGGTFTVEAGTYYEFQEGSSTAGTNINVYAYSPFYINGLGQLVLLSNYSSSYLVASNGAEVDVSGAAGTVQVAGPRGTNSSVWSWSDAGTVSADVAGFAWGGRFAAAGGRYVGADGNTYADPRANNGTIILGGASINLSQDTSAIASLLSNFQQGTPPNALYVAASQLAPFDNVYLYAAVAEGGAARIFTDLNGNNFGLAPPSFSGAFNITGSVNLDVANRLHIAAADISASPASSISAQLTAPYIELTGGGGNTVSGTSALTISGQTIDLESAAFSGFSQVNLISSGDLRLSTPKVADGYIPTGGTLPNDTQTFTGSLVSKGNLLLSAQRIYPVSAVTFTIQTPGNVQFTAPAGSNTSIPLAAGGGIDVFASTIDQAGNLFAPLGQITLGNTNTQSVTLEPGSLTSVTLANTIVPYGATVDGTNWYYNASLNPLSQPPSKGVVLAGSNVSVTQGSTIDLRGGGNLQAMEWVQGKGGSRDTLTTTPSGQTVYALVPSVNAPVAAYDIDFATSRSLNNGATVTAGDTNPLVGTQITIAGGGGIAAGTYTLYPAHYATLPGAMRVVVYQNSNLGRNIPSGTSLPDGTVLVTGNYTQSTATGKQSTGQTVFAVQTNAVWQTYSEYQFSSANSYFANQAAKNGTIIPLPMDAGSLQASALQSIILKGTFLGRPGQDSSGNLGHGSELDISSPQMIDVVGDAQYASGNVPAGYLAVDVSQLDNAGFDSVLIGGLRTTTTSGTVITPTSTGILVDTRGQAFTAPEILLVATPAVAGPNYLFTYTDRGTVTIASSSVINTTGTVNEAAGRNYYFGALPGTVTAQSVATALGGTLDSSGTLITGANGTISSAGIATVESYARQTGALFVATNDTTLNVSGPTATPLTVQFAPGAPVSGPLTLAADAGKVTLGSGASITTKALTLQATASTQSIAINTSDLHVGQLNLTAQTIALGSTSPLTNVSLPLYNFQFADVGGLTLKALSGTITIYGNYNPGQAVNSLTLDAAALAKASGSGDAVISTGGLVSGVGTITLLNSGATAAPALPTVSGQSTLSFDAPNIVLGSANLTSAQMILGYANVNLEALGHVSIAGPGSLTLGAASDAVNLSVATPGIFVAGASGANNGSFAITTGGNISVVDSFTQSGVVSRPADSSDVGGNLALTAASISVGSVIQAQAGTITLEATAGDVRLNPRAYLDAAGYVTTLVDVVTYQAGGKVVLQADKGNVNTSALSIIDVAQPAGGLGYGGEVDVSALNGNATLNGFQFGGGGPGHGGTFNLNILGKSGQSFDLTSLADQLLAGGFTGSISVETRTGNLDLAANHTLKANSITLTADDTTWVGNDVTQQFGQIYIAGLIDAGGYAGTTSDGAGGAGGQVSLYGANSVTLASSGVINASTTHADQRGGDVTVGIGWSANGKIFLQQGTQINVSGGTQGGLSGGTVTFSAPLDGNNDMKIAVLSDVRDSATGAFDQLPTISGITITGARSVTFDGYVAFDTTSSKSNYGLGGSSLGWNGFIDPLGWYTSYTSPTNYTLATSGNWTNVTGYSASAGTPIFGFRSAPPDQAISGSSATIHPVMGAYQFFVSGRGLTSNQVGVGMTVTFAPPKNPDGTLVQGGVAATGVVKPESFGQYSVQITNPGSGYSSAPTSYTVNGNTITASSSSLQIVSVQINGAGNGISTAPSSVTFRGPSGSSSGLQTVSFSQGSGFSGTMTNGVFTPSTNNFIPLSSSIVFNPATQGQAGVGTFAGNTPNQNFLTSTLAQFTQGNGLPSTITGNYGFSNLFNRLEPLVSQLGASVVQVQPGVQLVNSTSSGSITVLNNWNLASGTAGNLQTATNPVTNTSFQYFNLTSNNPASISNVSFNYRLVTPWGNLEAGDLTLRAAGNINVNASISDGFFQFGNYLDSNYVAWVNSYLTALDGTTSNGLIASGYRAFSNNYSYYLNGASGVPIAPYNAAGNSFSPTSQNLAAADLFPNSLNVCTSSCNTSNPTVTTVTAPASWSYAFTAGADLASANPTARTGSIGDVIVSNHSSYTQTLATIPGNPAQSVTVNLPTMIRTGTGDITIAAAGNVMMQDTTAPGVIYAAGVSTPLLPAANYSGGSSVVAGNPDGFFEPQVLAYGNSALVPYYGPPTAAAFPEMGGDVLVEAQRDIVGYSGAGNKVPQYYQPWLLADSGLTPAPQSAAGSVALFGAGVFAPYGSQIASQTAWWIQYGSFQQGILSAGGNVTVVAGGDIKDVSVSLPTTGRVSGGLTAGSTPVTHLYGSGNMVVRAGRNILGGSFYEGSGDATIFARGAIGQNGTVSMYASSPLQLPDVPLLAVDTGRIEMVSLGSLTISGVVNPAALQRQNGSWANPLQTTSTLYPLYFDTYGPDSGVSLVTQTGNLTIEIAPTAINEGSVITAAPATYPASLQAIALNGNLVTTGIQSINAVSGTSIPMPGIVLSPSDHGAFELLAQGSVDLTFGYPNNRALLQSTPRPYISAGSALVDTGFDPFQPNSGFDGSSSGALLAHADDAQEGIDATARIYAVTGSIKATGNYGPSYTGDPTTSYQIIQINRPTEIHAGTDIKDLNIIIQNIHPGDVSTITAGRNISYTGYNNGGGIQVAGPGFLVVQAGGDIGPFLPSNFDNGANARVQEGIASVGNASATPVGDIYLSKYSVGIYDQALFGAAANPRRNTQLTAAAGTSQGASIDVLFGVKFGADYQSVIDNYIDPLTSGNSGSSNLPALQAYLQQLGYPSVNQQQALTMFLQLPLNQQLAFVSQSASFSGQNYALNVSGIQKYLQQLGYPLVDQQQALTIFLQQLPRNQQLAFFNQIFAGQNDLLAPGGSATDPQTSWMTFYILQKLLSPDLQQVLVDQVFFSEIKNVGKISPTATTCPQVCQPAWKVINTLFPSGHTVGTSELNLLHGTIQTRLGGDVSIFGPGGSITVGSLSTEPNPDLRLRDLGILTLGGGNINTYTDGSVLVNSSRVLTTQGGDVLMWSSYGDLDAGRGSKTIVSAPALQVQFDQNDYETIDPAGYVAGSGIATLQASSTAAASNVYLVAPNGTIDFGTAGVRSSGQLVVVAPVITNQSNATFTTSNITPTVNVAGLTTGSNTAGAAAKSADTATASGPSEHDHASVFIVEVVGYGGGDSSSEAAPGNNSSGSALGDEKRDTP